MITEQDYMSLSLNAKRVYDLRYDREKRLWKEVVIFYPKDLKKEYQNTLINEIVKLGINALRYSQYEQARQAMNVIYVDDEANSALLKCAISHPVGGVISDWKIEKEIDK